MDWIVDAMHEMALRQWEIDLPDPSDRDCSYSARKGGLMITVTVKHGMVGVSATDHRGERLIHVFDDGSEYITEGLIEILEETEEEFLAHQSSPPTEKL